MFYQERDLIDQPDTLDEENKNPNRSVSIVDLETFSYLWEFIFTGSYITYLNLHFCFMSRNLNLHNDVVIDTK